MRVKTPHGNYEVKNITFKDRRTLHRLELQAISTDGNLKTNEFIDVLDWVMNHAFEDPEAKLSKLDDNQVDEVLMEIYNSYKGTNKKKS